MRISRKKRPEKPLIPHFRKNLAILSPQVLLLDENGKSLGVKPIAEAQRIAEERELDLVEINPVVTPPVVKIIDFTEFKYQKEKEAKKQKAHSRASDIKGIRLSVRIGEHDLEIKKAQAEKFLERGDKVKIELILRGRENVRPDMAREVINKFIHLVDAAVPIRQEQDIQRQGHKISAIIAKR